MHKWNCGYFVTDQPFYCMKRSFISISFIRIYVWGQEHFLYISYSWIIFSSLFFCNENLTLVHKSGGLLFEKWKKMSQISVAIILSRWKPAFKCWGSVSDFFAVYDRSDSHLIETEQWSARKYSERERKASERADKIEGKEFKKQEKESPQSDRFITDRLGFLGNRTREWF